MSLAFIIAIVITCTATTASQSHSYARMNPCLSFQDMMPAATSSQQPAASSQQQLTKHFIDVRVQGVQVILSLLHDPLGLGRQSLVPPRLLLCKALRL